MSRLRKTRLARRVPPRRRGGGAPLALASARACSRTAMRARAEVRTALDESSWLGCWLCAASRSGGLFFRCCSLARKARRTAAALSISALASLLTEAEAARTGVSRSERVSSAWGRRRESQGRVSKTALSSGEVERSTKSGAMSRSEALAATLAARPLPARSKKFRISTADRVVLRAARPHRVDAAPKWMNLAARAARSGV
mmetsp:Transcript_19710/g.62043  ORF Transcript_19710/g.62043 Transcript_19710/m.62043 type:complete len:201 (-) Transcript_19710:2-604(-)